MAILIRVVNVALLRRDGAAACIMGSWVLHGMVFKVGSGTMLGRMAASPFGLEVFICVMGPMKNR